MRSPPSLEARHMPRTTWGLRPGVSTIFSGLPLFSVSCQLSELPPFFFFFFYVSPLPHWYISPFPHYSDASSFSVFPSPSFRPAFRGAGHVKEVAVYFFLLRPNRRDEGSLERLCIEPRAMQEGGRGARCSQGRQGRRPSPSNSVKRQRRLPSTPAHCQVRTERGRTGRRTDLSHADPIQPATPNPSHFSPRLSPPAPYPLPPPPAARSTRPAPLH